LGATLIASLASPADVVPPVFSVVVAFVAAALATVRVTVVVACAAVIQAMLLAWVDAERVGWSLVWRALFVAASGALAVALAVLRERRERELREARVDLQESHLLRTLAATSRDPIYLKDRDGRYLLANDATARSVGLTSGQELRGRRDRELLPSEVADTIEAEDQRVFRSANRQEFEDVLDVAGEPHTYLTHKAPLLDDQGSVVGLTAVAKDITVRRQALSQLQESEQRLARLSEARRLVAEVASRVAVASEPEAIAREALAVLHDHLPPHSGSVVLSTADDPGAWQSLAFSNVPPALAARWRDTVPDHETPLRDVVASGRGVSFSDPATYAAAYPDLAADIAAAGMSGPTYLEPLAAGNRVLGVLAVSFRASLADLDAASVARARARGAHRRFVPGGDARAARVPGPSSGRGHDLSRRQRAARGRG
jgi:PAS domain S-box-containing protein